MWYSVLCRFLCRFTFRLLTSQKIRKIRYTDTNSVKNPAFYKGFFSSVRSNRTAYRFRSLHLSVIRFRALVSEGSKQSVHSFSFTSLRFIRSHTVCIELASSHGGLRPELASKQWKHSQLQTLRYRFADPPLFASACFRRWALVVWVMAEKAARCLHSGISNLMASQWIQRVRNLKLRARKKCSPFPP